jgi:polyisoprenoid-binding protein YceI
MATATIPFTGTFDADPVHSSFGFAVRYQGVSLFKGTMGEVAATLVGDENGAKLEGTAKVESISIRTPEQFRAHVLSDDFFGVEQHPEVTFASTSIDFNEDGTAHVTGDLTIKGTTQPVVAAGTWTAPAADAFGATRGHLNLEAVVDRTAFGLSWNMDLPTGGKVLANDVTLTIEASLVERADA